MEHADIRTLEADARDDVGRAAGVFPPGFPAELGRSVAGFPPRMKALMANDLHAGTRLDLDWLAGKVVASDANTVANARPGTALRDPKALSKQGAFINLRGWSGRRMPHRFRRNHDVTTDTFTTSRNLEIKGRKLGPSPDSRAAVSVYLVRWIRAGFAER
jgi:hypothetical protein